MRLILLSVMLLSLAGCSRGSEKLGETGRADGSEEAKTATSSTPEVGVELVTAALLNGKLDLSLPKDFRLMGEEMLRLKYPSERRPTSVYTNTDGSVNIAVNHTQNSLKSDQLAEFHEDMEQMMKNLYPSAEWFRSELTTINGREFFVLEFRTPAIDTQIHNVMLVTSLDERMLLVSCNATVEVEDVWAATFKRIIQSIRIVE